MRERLHAILMNEPSLTDFGFGIFSADRCKPLAERQAIFAEERARLLASVDRIDATCTWIEANLWPIKSINPHRNSYGLKHCAERDIGYLTNGVFIAAMLLCGYRCVGNGGPNAWFNVSQKSIQHMHRRHEPRPENRICI